MQTTVVTQRSGFLDLLEFGDLVLADRGFLIEEDVTAIDCYISLSSLIKRHSQLSQKSVECSRQLARIRIERAITYLRYRDNSVHVHECSPFWVGISTICL